MPSCRATAKAPPTRPKRVSAEYARGWEAFYHGKPNEDCPYAIGSGDRRVHWFDGWYDAKYQKFFRELCFKYPV